MVAGAGCRNKGARGQGRFAAILRARDYDVTQVTAGILAEDLVARRDDKVWSVEVKNTKAWQPGFLKQARAQAALRRARWMLAWSIPGTRSWLVLRQGERPVLWHENVAE